MEKIDWFKDSIHKGMIHNFETDGNLTPILAYIQGDQPYICGIPNFLSDYKSKLELKNLIRSLCLQPNVFIVILIFEAYIAKIELDDPMKDKVLNGDMRVSEMNEKQDAIIMVVSTPQSEEIIGYCVDPEKKEVGEKIESDSISGLLSGFFNWSKN